MAGFVRPFGRDVESTPLFVDESSGWPVAAAPRPERTPAPLRPLRALLAPLAARAGRPAPAGGDCRCGVLFQLASPGYLRMYGSTIQVLAERGHTVLLSYDDAEKRRDPAAAAFERLPGVEVVPPLPPAARPHEDRIARRRAAADYLRYLDRRFAGAPYLRRRLDKYLQGGWRALARLPYGTPGAGAARRLVLAQERRVPSDPGVERALSAHAPDAVLVTPLIGRSERNRRQTDTVKAARRLGIPVAFGVAELGPSDDEGGPQGRPGRGVRLERDPAARRGRAARARGGADRRHGRAALGSMVRPCALDRPGGVLRASRPASSPYVLWVGSSPNVAPRRAGDRARPPLAGGAARRRGAGRRRRVGPASPLRRRCRGPRSTSAPGRRSHRATPPALPMTEADEALYFDSIHHAAAVVGINTSAMVESFVQRRPVLTIRAAEFRETQAARCTSASFRCRGGCLADRGDLEEHAPAARAWTLPPDRRRRSRASCASSSARSGSTGRRRRSWRTRSSASLPAASPSCPYPARSAASCSSIGELPVRRRHSAAQARGERADRRGGERCRRQQHTKERRRRLRRGRAQAPPRRPSSSIASARIGAAGRSSRAAGRRIGRNARLLGVLVAALEHVGELVSVLVERLADVEEAAVLVEEVAEVQRPACVPANSGASGASTLLPRIAASISALVLMPTTAALCASESKKSARASPASGWAPARRPDDDVPDVGEVDAVATGRRSADAAGRGRRARAGAASRPRGAAPSQRRTKRDLVRGDERRRADVEHVRARPGRARPARRTPRAVGARRAARTTRRTSARRWRRPARAAIAVHLGRLARLALVPDEDAVGHDADQALARQVVPAGDRDARTGIPARAGALHVLDLAARELDDRRDEHDVGPLLAEVVRRSRGLVGIARSTAPSARTSRRESRSLVPRLDERIEPQGDAGA